MAKAKESLKKQEEFANKGKVTTQPKKEEKPKESLKAKKTPPAPPAPVAEPEESSAEESEEEESEEEPAKQFVQINKKKQAPAPLVGQGKKTKTQLQKEALNTVTSSPTPE